MKRKTKIPTLQDRDNVLRLKEMGWTVKEISIALDFSKDEVELILKQAHVPETLLKT